MRGQSTELNELATALTAAQAEFVAIPKTDTNPFFKSKYAGMPQVVAVASPILTKHGLSISQHIGHDEQGNDTLTTWLLHKSGQYICDEMRLHISAAKGLSEVQAQGSTVTYSKRYAYMAVLGLVADEDDDGNASTPPAAQQQKAGNGGEPKLATPADVKSMVAAAKGLEPAQVKLALAACGLDGVDNYGRVPASKVVDLTKRLAGIER